MKTFLKSQFEVQGTEVESTNIYADIREKNLCFAVCNDFSIEEYIAKHGLSLYNVQALKGENRIDTYSKIVGDYKIFLYLEYLNNLPNMVTITGYYQYD